MFYQIMRRASEAIESKGHLELDPVANSLIELIGVVRGEEEDAFVVFKNTKEG